jgi:endonuclease/exonuclease/phosphatase family metal-dependent hydrolase
MARGRVAVCLLAGAFLAAAFAAAAGSTNPRTITVATFNLYQGTELEHVLAATDATSLVAGVASDYANVIATNFPARAAALAGEIAESGAALVGLQEVATWQVQPPLPSYDFLQILLGALTARGLHYETVIVHENLRAAAPGAFPGIGIRNVSFSEQTAIIARTDLPTDELKLSNAEAHDFVAHSAFPFLGQPFSIGGSWLSVDAKVRGKTVRFVTTHMDPIPPDPLVTIRTLQARELLAGPASGDVPVIIAGDLNSDVGSRPYNTLIGGGLLDTWAALFPGNPGFTCCQVPPDTIVNPVSKLHNRVDQILTSDGLVPLSETILGGDPSARIPPTGLWPSDHAGLTATLEIEPNP